MRWWWWWWLSSSWCWSRAIALLAAGPFPPRLAWEEAAEGGDGGGAGARARASSGKLTPREQGARWRLPRVDATTACT